MNSSYWSALREITNSYLWTQAIDTLRFTLDNAGLKGRISHRLSLLFPDDPITDHLLRPSN